MNTQKKKFEDFASLWETIAKQDHYHVESVKTDVGFALRALLENSELSKATFAKKIGKSAAYISKIFRGDVNFTIESMVRLARALDGEVKISIVKVPDQAQAVPASYSRQYVSQMNGSIVFGSTDGVAIQSRRTAGAGQVSLPQPRFYNPAAMLANIPETSNDEIAHAA